MKKWFKNNTKLFIGIIIGVIIAGTSVYAATIYYQGSNVGYDNSTTGFKDSNNQDVEDVQTALDELYTMANDVAVIRLDAQDGNATTILNTVILPTPKREGYIFNGWYTASSGGTRVGGGGDSYTATERITLYAQWTEVICGAFANDSWETIIAKVKGNTSGYCVGDTKTVELGNSLGTHTLRIANTSTPAECSTTGFSQTACGFVLEFADIITTRTMNSSNTNVGGWPASEMRTYLNNTNDTTSIYNSLPTVIKDAIINTTVVSGHGSTSGEANFTSTDKLYLLSTHEVWKDVDGNTSSGIDYYDTSYNNTRQLDYYVNQRVTTSNYAGAIKQQNGSNYLWWLRSANSGSTTFVFYSAANFGVGAGNRADLTLGVAPAFRIA